MIDPHGELTERGQKIEDQAILKRVARELDAIATRQLSHTDTLLQALEGIEITVERLEEEIA